jgi:hypothetical protein
VKDSAVIIGDNNTVNQTIIQKFFNIFKSDSETLEHRNRRILLGHVENAWIKGVLDASLHGAALLDLGIKQDPNAVKTYPWAIKKESTDETLPAGTSMLEIFDSIGMGRSLLILGAPGSGKTTMLLELGRQLIERAREDVTQPIPMVFNLASWTEKLTFADWLAQELNNLYSVPRKIAPDWVKGDKLFLLLDGLDEVRQESRVKCVEAINTFRKEHGLTSLAVCSRSQDYVDLNAKLSFEGAIEVQPLTQEQITEFFNRFGKEMAGIKQVLQKDSVMREMAETPLLLSIMIMAYRDKQDVEILVSGDETTRRKHLFDTYIQRMLERPRARNTIFSKLDVLRWLSGLADRMIANFESTFLLDDMQVDWLHQLDQFKQYKLIVGLIVGLDLGLFTGLGIGQVLVSLFGLTPGLIIGLIFGLPFGSFLGLNLRVNQISAVDSLSWNWEKAKKGLNTGLKFGLFFSLIGGLIYGLASGLINGLVIGLGCELIFGLIIGLLSGLSVAQVNKTKVPGQRLIFTMWNFITVIPIFGLLFGLFGVL